MKWVEMIRVRSSSEGIAELHGNLPQIVSTLRKKEEISEVFVLLHALYLGDLAVILIWNGPGKPRKSPPGNLLAKNFEEYGTVEHSVWLIGSDFPDANPRFPDSGTTEGNHPGEIDRLKFKQRITFGG